MLLDSAAGVLYGTTWLGGALGGGVVFRQPLHYLLPIHASADGAWTIGSFQRIQWAHNLGPGTRFKIELSGDGGQTWKTIGFSQGEGRKGSFEWRVTGPVTGRGRLRVTSLDDESLGGLIVPFTTSGMIR